MGSGDEELAEVVHRASELYDAARNEPRIDPREVAADLGIPAEYVAKAEAERAELRRRSRRQRFAFLVAAAVTVLAGGALLLASFLGRRPNGPRSAARPSGPRVAIDVDHCEEPREGARSLASANATPTLIRGGYTSTVLEGFDVVVLSHCRTSPLTDADIDALRAFVSRGGGLVVADLGWSWVHYTKRPLGELPANRLGRTLGFSFGEAVLGPPAPGAGSGLEAGPIATRSGWSAGDVSLDGPDARVWLRDADQRAMAGVVPHGLGRVAVFGHHGILDDNPALLARAVERVRR